VFVRGTTDPAAGLGWAGLNWASPGDSPVLLPVLPELVSAVLFIMIILFNLIFLSGFDFCCFFFLAFQLSLHLYALGKTERLDLMRGG